MSVTFCAASFALVNASVHTQQCISGNGRPNVDDDMCRRREVAQEVPRGSVIVIGCIVVVGVFRLRKLLGNAVNM